MTLCRTKAKADAVCVYPAPLIQMMFFCSALVVASHVIRLVAQRLKFLLVIGTVKFVEVALSEIATGVVSVLLPSVSCSLRRLLNYLFTRRVLPRCSVPTPPLRILFVGTLLPPLSRIRSATRAAAAEVEWA